MGSGGHLEVVFGAPKTDSMRECALGVAKTPGNHLQSIRNKILERSYAAFFFLTPLYLGEPSISRFLT
jgi:hypothetical protein